MSANADRTTMATPVRALTTIAGLAIALNCVPVLGQGDPLAEPFPATSTVDDFSDGARGVLVETSGFRLASISGLGDINGDGIDDFGVDDFQSRPPSGIEYEGSAFVVFGVEGGLPSPIVLEDLDGTNGFRLRTFAAFDLTSSPVAAGDVNGDGIDDILISGVGGGGYGSGEPGASLHGKAYIVFGRGPASGGFPAEFDLRDLDGSNGVRLEPIGGDQVGRERFGLVAAAGDINNDGLGDVAVGASAADVGSLVDSGRVYVFFGQREPFPAVLRGGDLDGTNGLRVVNPQPSGFESGWVAQTGPDGGDVNGDGIDDLLVGTRFPSAAHVVFGRDGEPFPADLDLRDLDGSDGFLLAGSTSSARIGAALAIGGDVNGDGIDDLALGAPFSGPRGVYSLAAGRTFVVFGSRDGFPARLDVSALDGTNGFRIDGDQPEDSSGSAVAIAGDLNGDGFDDLAIGAQFRGSRLAGYYLRAGPGATYVVFGRGAAAPPVLSLADVAQDEIIRIDGDDRTTYFGSTVARAGDINGDGTDDLVAAALGEEGYVIYGRTGACPADLDGDGELTIFDFLEFGNLFDAGDPRADFDGDGSLTLFDFLAFQNAFDAGCP